MTSRYSQRILSAMQHYNTFLRGVRENLGYSMGKMAVEVGVSLSTVWQWEEGRKKPSPLSAWKIEYIIKNKIKDKEKRSALIERLRKRK